VRGYFYHNDDTLIRHDFGSEKELIIALHKGRINYAIDVLMESGEIQRNIHKYSKLDTQ
jgi:hypothetical protein